MSIMEWMFGKQLTPQEKLKMNQRSLQRAIRELDREKRKLEQQEGKLVADIKMLCKKGQLKQAKIKSKDLIRTKKYENKFDLMSTKLNMINLRIQSIRSSDLMTKSLREATGLLNSMNKGINLPQLQKIAMDFEKQNEMMDQKQEMMDDALDDVFDEEEDEEEADEFLNQVMDEIGIDLKTMLNKETPENSLQTEADVSVEHAEKTPVALGVDEDLQNRLNSLKR